MKKIWLFLFVLIISTSAYAQQMTNGKLGEIIKATADTVVGQDGRWQFLVRDRMMLCITDSTHNRMRIISPVAEVSELEEKEILNALVANFHTALDVKYAISEDQMWSVYLHPLRELTEEQASDAIIQVYNAASTFGTIYSSTDLSFPGRGPDDEPGEPSETNPKLQKG